MRVNVPYNSYVLTSVDTFFPFQPFCFYLNILSYVYMRHSRYTCDMLVYLFILSVFFFDFAFFSVSSFSCCRTILHTVDVCRVTFIMSEMCRWLPFFSLSFPLMPVLSSHSHLSHRLIVMRYTYLHLFFLFFFLCLYKHSNMYVICNIMYTYTYGGYLFIIMMIRTTKIHIRHPASFTKKSKRNGKTTRKNIEIRHIYMLYALFYV